MYDYSISQLKHKDASIENDDFTSLANHETLASKKRKQPILRYLKRKQQPLRHNIKRGAQEHLF
jgi:hypothetical protein